jgi:ferritin
MGQDDRADSLLERKGRHMGRGDRDDLARFLANEQIRGAYEKGDYDGAMDTFEDVLKDQKKEGQKIFGLMQNYLMLAAATKQDKRAAKFLKRYVSSLERIYGNTPDNKRLFLTILAKAYEQAGDDRNLKRVQKDLQKLH